MTNDDFSSAATGRITRIAVISQIYREQLSASVPHEAGRIWELLRMVDDIEARAKAAIEADPAPFDYAVMHIRPEEFGCD